MLEATPGRKRVAEDPHVGKKKTMLSDIDNFI